MPKPVTPIDSPWLKPTAVAEILGVDVKTIYALVQNGQLPSHKLNGRLIRIHRDDIDKALGRTERIAPAADPFDGLTDEQVAKLTAAVDMWPTLPAEKRETLSALFAVQPERRSA